MFGAVKKCDHCGRTFDVFDTEIWAYRRVMRMPEDRSQRQHWFCTWGCLVQAQREADEYFDGLRAERIARARRRMRAYSAAQYAKRKEQRTT